MHESPSISRWIASLKAGELDAAQALWNEYAIRLTELARKKLGSVPKVVADEEDIAQSVFRSICRGAIAGRFGDVTNRDDLWWLLLAITKQKVVDYIRRETSQKRGAGRVKHEAALACEFADNAFTLDSLVGEAPTPDFLFILQEQSTRLLKLLRDDRLRKIAISRIEGYTVPEIAADLAISTRSVERKLQLIRKAWAKDLSDVG